MPSSFHRLTGTHRDTAELCYISALSQTQRGDVRRDGSIRAADIALFLRSRYGVLVSEEEVTRLVLPGLAGTDDGDGINSAAAAAEDGGTGDDERSTAQDKLKEAVREVQDDLGPSPADEEEGVGAEGGGDGGAVDDGVIDLAELTAVLLMPALVKLAAAACKSDGTACTDSTTCTGTSCHKTDADDKNIPTSNSKSIRRSEDIHDDGAIIGCVLNLILREALGHDAPTGSDDKYPRLTIDLLRIILRAYGEDELADDDELLQQMIQCAAAGTSGNEGVEDVVRLDPPTFARVLTADLSLLNPDDEYRITTNYHDVLAAGTINNVDADEADEEKDKAMKEKDVEEASPVQAFAATASGGATTSPPLTFKSPKFTTDQIDFAASRYASKPFVFLLWASFTVFLFSELNLTNDAKGKASGFASTTCYYSGDDDALNLEDDAYWDCYETYGQKIGNAIVSWLIKFGLYVGFGYAFVGFGSLGNSLGKNRRGLSLLGLLSLAAVAVGFFFWRWFYPGEGNDTVAFWFTQFVYLILASFVLIMHAWTVLGLGGKLKEATTSEVHTEAEMKQAAAYKSRLMIKNALRLHSTTSMVEKGSNKDDGSIVVEENGPSLSNALLNLSLEGEKSELIGGWMWCWKNFFSGRLAREEGLKLSARILALNLVQGLIAIFLLLAGITLTAYVGNVWEAGKDNAYAYTLGPVLVFLNIDLDQLKANVQASGVCYLLPDPMLCDQISTDAIRNIFNDAADELYPHEKYMVTAPMIVLAVIAFAYAGCLFFLYIPSVCSTMLRFRSGQLPLFESKERFTIYRTRVDSNTLLLGTLFWSGIFAPILIGSIIGAIVFLFAWQATRPAMLSVVASIIGIIVVIIIKQILARIFVTKEYHGMYRRNVNKVNIYSLALESLTLGVGVLTAAVRAFKIVVVSVLFIGRIDTPLLNSELSVGPLGDKHPDHFRKELLVQEAHRHPYIETIGKMYLMKYRHQARFVSNAGYSFRLLFTVALMPWLRKYRLCNRNGTGIDNKEANKIVRAVGSAVTTAKFKLQSVTQKP